ncbi:MAG TPA: peptide deformylase [Geminicoccaceae bacterium]|mgnify:CR=1 FL=1|nr:peptide deformylase [Geminicoccus sp.]HMU49567.1 peptide deformylase [Geminicoccaceae bacterium]
MSLLQILQAPHPGLKRVAQPVAEVTDEVRRLMDDMLETMYGAPGIGLAAPQVGVDRRIVVVDVSREENDRNPLRLINPELVWTSDDSVTMEEGCLSLPEQFAEVKRPSAVRLRYLDEAGAPQEVAADGMLARCLQHEVDHLDGILFVDHLSALRRNMILRKLEKARRARA